MRGFIGNAAAAGFLRAGLAAGRPAHAYLLTGPARVGKRTLAKAFAAALVCKLRPAPHSGHGGADDAATASLMPTLDLGLEVTAPAALFEEEAEAAGPSDSGAGVADVPCGRCRACGLVERDAHPDVRLTEVEAGHRQIRIHQIRQMEHDAGLRPYEAPVKVFILTDAHLMVVDAANALLKTLEEPPADTILVLTAADPSQVLPTIASRCQEVPLRPVPAGEIEAALRERYTGTEGLDPALAALLSRLSGGRPGWALAALADPELLAAREEEASRLESLVARSPVSRLPAAGSFADAAGARAALDVWLGWWRDALLVRHGCAELVTNVDRLEQLKRLAPSATECWQATRRVQAAREQVDANANVRLAMESLLLDLPAPAP
jgi:DNA polymerase III subunit delta'